MRDENREARMKRLIIIACILAAVGLAFGSAARLQEYPTVEKYRVQKP